MVTTITAQPPAPGSFCWFDLSDEGTDTLAFVRGIKHRTSDHFIERNDYAYWTIGTLRWRNLNQLWNLGGGSGLRSSTSWRPGNGARQRRQAFLFVRNRTRSQFEQCAWSLIWILSPGFPAHIVKALYCGTL
jgi:hypothetical protein